jgi:hypothetical protein
MENNRLALFEEKEIRKVWMNNRWYFSIIDVIFVLTDSINPRDYWYKLKIRVDEEEKIELSTICRQLKLKATDGKNRLTDCADTEGILRIIQSIPSPKAEPFKRWLAQVGSERIEEINNPELAMDRMKALYEKKGYSKPWIEQRERGIATRHNLTDEWRERGANIGKDYAILTNEIYKSGFDLTAKQYRNIKGIHESRNLRDSMTNIELALTNLGEASSVEIHKKHNSFGMNNLKKDINTAGKVIKKAREELEKELDSSVVTSDNFLDLTEDKKEIIKNK